MKAPIPPTEQHIALGHSSQPVWLGGSSPQSRPHTVPLLGLSWAQWSLIVASSPMLTQSAEMVLPEVVRSHGPGWPVHKFPASAWVMGATFIPALCECVLMPLL